MDNRIRAPENFTLANADSSARIRAVSQLIRRFTQIAIPSVVLLVLAGLYNTWVHIESFQAFWSTSYGRTLLLKRVEQLEARVKELEGELRRAQASINIEVDLSEVETAAQDASGSFGLAEVVSNVKADLIGYDVNGNGAYDGATADPRTGIPVDGFLLAKQR